MHHKIATVLAITLFLLGITTRAQDRTLEEQSPEHVAGLISQLSHEKYSVREGATNQLIQCGVAAVPDLLDACTSENSETAWRAVQILEQVGLEGDVNDAKLVIRGLITVGSQGHSHLLGRVQKFAERYQEYKSELAIQKIRSMGGQVNETPNYNVAGVRVIGGFGGGRVIIGAPPEVDARIIDKMRVLEAIKVEDLRAKPVEEVKPQEPKKPDANGRDDRNGDCNSIDEDEDQEQQQVQQVEAVIDLDAVPKQVEIDADAVEPQDHVLPDLDAILLDLDSSQTSQVMRSITIDADWTGGADGLSYLSQVHNLNYVQLQGIELSSAVFEQLAKIKTLNQLGVDACSFSVSEIQRFAGDHPELYMRVTGKAVLGVMPTQETSAEQAGCKLDRVIEDSPAFKAGLQPGDMITSVDAYKVVDFPTLTYTVAGREVGDTVTVKALRDGKELEFKVTLGPRGAILP